jgi:hypothetical protein
MDKLNKHDVAQLKAIGVCYAEVESLKATVEAMKQENDDRRAEGDTDAYPPESFWAVSEALHKLAEELKNA